ncbi:MAG: YdcF family protein [Eubacteriales bacterium]
MYKFSRTAAVILAICLACFSAGTGFAEEGPAAGSRTSQDIIEEMAVYYGTYGSEADSRIEALLRELEALDPAAAASWTRIMDLWRSVQTELPITLNVLPDGLPETDELCLVVLGFQLNPDGSMREELVERLRVALACAEKYPKAWIVCTGGGTAAEDPAATEAGRMAEWLIGNGVAPERVIVENQSLTTAQNAIYTFDILEKHYPQVSRVAIISSDYHIATGTLLFGAEAILRAGGDGHEPVRIAANAAWHAPSGMLSMMFQAGALIELSGDVETAFDIYYETYDIHELPALKTDS